MSHNVTAKTFFEQNKKELKALDTDALQKHLYKI